MLKLLGNLGDGVKSAISKSSELEVTTSGTTKILMLKLSGYLSSSHKAAKVGNANVACGAFDISTYSI